MDRIKQAVDLFTKGHNCSQAVLAPYAEEFGLPMSTVLKISGGFGGGIGRQGHICGALTGAIMVLGLKYGTDNPTDKTSKNDLYKRVKQISEEFKIRAGSMFCKDLLGFDMTTPEGMEQAKAPGAYDECPEYVRIAVEILDQDL